MLMRMKMGRTVVCDIESSSMTLKTWRKEPEKKYGSFEPFFKTDDAKTNINQIEINILKLFRK